MLGKLGLWLMFTSALLSLSAKSSPEGSRGSQGQEGHGHASGVFGPMLLASGMGLGLEGPNLCGSAPYRRASSLLTFSSLWLGKLEIGHNSEQAWCMNFACVLCQSITAQRCIHLDINLKIWPMFMR